MDTPISEFEGLDRFFNVVYPLGFALRATTQHVGKAGGLQILRCQGFEVNYYNFTLDAPAWRDHTSDFISFGARLDSEALRLLQR